MKTIPAIFASLTLLISMVACQPSKNKNLIVGNWQAVNWTAAGQAVDRNVASTSFTFDAKANYTFSNNGNTEKGTYKIEEDALYTTAEKQEEIKVQLHFITNDTLAIDMNRGGTAEVVTLVRK